MTIPKTHSLPSSTRPLTLMALAAAGLGLAAALPRATSRLDLTVTYTGPEQVDDEHPISVLVFDGPDMAGGNKMIAAGHLTENGGVLTWTDLPEEVYVAAVYDPLGCFSGLSGMIPGSAIGVYTAADGASPAPIEVLSRTRVSFEFDDSQRLPGDPDAIVPPAVRGADEGILEIRKYTAREGQREAFIEFFVEKTLAPQKAAGLRVTGQFRSLENEDQFVWIRSYRNQAERTRALRDYYLGPDWIAVQDEAAGLIANTEVWLVAPTEASQIR